VAPFPLIKNDKEKMAQVTDFFGGGNADLSQNSLKARAPRNYLIIKAEVILHNHFPTTRPEKRFSPLISLHRTMVTGLQ